jgi:hypothetical protein
MDYLVFQDMIGKLDGVINVKVIYDDNEIKEVHILSNSSRSPKQIVRDIESSLLAAYDFRIDRKVISIAQIDIYNREQVRRAKFNGASIRTEGNALECSVKLLYNGEEYCDAVIGVKTAANRRKIVADATVKTVEKILGQAYLFSIEDVIVNTSRDITFVTVLVGIVINESEETMVGSAIVKDDIDESIAKATLDAVNRRIQKGTI